MADSLYLSLWYPNLRLEELGDKVMRVLLEFPKHGGEALVYSTTVWPINWSETPIFQRVYRSVNRVMPAQPSGPQLVGNDFTFDEPEAQNPLGELKVVHGIDPGIAVAESLENLHEDYAYEFQIGWALWELDADDQFRWVRQNRMVRVTAFGPLFDDGSYEQDGHIRIDFGNDAAFLEEDLDLDEIGSRHVEENLKQLITIAHAVEKSSGATARLLWSEMGESLALRLMQRLNVGN